MSEHKAIPETCGDTRLIFERLMKMEPGETIRYEELGSLLGVPVHRRWHCLETARRKALMEQNRVYESVRGMGIKRLNDSEIVQSGGLGARRIRRTAKKSARKLASVSDYSKLTNAEKHAHNTMLSVYAAIHQGTSPSALKRLQQEVAQTQQQLSVAKTLELFK